VSNQIEYNGLIIHYLPASEEMGGSIMTQGTRHLLEGTFKNHILICSTVLVGVFSERDSYMVPLLKISWCSSL
jgi:hypothetical protein